VLTIVGLTFLALAVVGVVLLISDILYGGAAVIGFTVGIAVVFVVLWYGIGLYLRLRH
jgi:O-antigen/teichoic acid export membrane protein